LPKCLYESQIWGSRGSRYLPNYMVSHPRREVTVSLWASQRILIFTNDSIALSVYCIHLHLQFPTQRSFARFIFNLHFPVTEHFTSIQCLCPASKIETHIPVTCCPTISHDYPSKSSRIRQEFHLMRYKVSLGLPNHSAVSYKSHVYIQSLGFCSWSSTYDFGFWEYTM
jgi:hypothetical protein